MADTAASQARRRYFEDFQEGDVLDLGQVEVTAAQIVAFASQFDPQPFHLDAAVAQSSIYGGLIASGWHTVGMYTRLLVDSVLADAASMGSPGFEVQWPAPVRPGDTLHGRWTVLSSRVSQSKPDRGLIRGRGELLNQRGEVVLQMEGVNLLGRRPTEA